MTAASPDQLRVVARQLVDLADELERSMRDPWIPQLTAAVALRWDPNDPTRAGKPSQAEVAEAMGYGIRAFQRRLKKSPGLWRRLTAHRPELSES